MKHVPHLVIGAPWKEGEQLPLSILQWRHLNKVLRLGEGDPVSYTDGLGVIGEGRLGSQVVDRGEETRVRPQRRFTVAAAPPASKERQRFLVEKLTELGVSHLQWLETRHGKNRPSAAPKVFTWVVAALEQSRGAWLMEVSRDLVGWEEIERPIVACDSTGGGMPADVGTVVIGPEGGWSPGELPEGVTLWNLGPTVLRTETAAVVAASRLLSV
jgi:16S rRNA (uracil1498-N3)-methyltransferase